MKTMKKQRKGFTLTELAIVIAVIAILIAVLVPTFVSLINKANQSNDSQLVKNFNTSLSTDETINGEHETVIDAIDVLLDDGYDLTKLTPTANNADIVYNATTHLFVYYTDDFSKLSYGEVNTDDILVVITDETLSRAATVNASSISNEVYYCVYEEEGANVSYADAATIYLYTESGTTTINATKATVYRYGASASDNVAVADNSYHLYGTVETVTLVQGHVELTSTAVVEDLVVENTTETQKVTYVKGAQITNIVDNNTGSNTCTYVAKTSESDEGTTYTNSSDFCAAEEVNNVSATEEVKGYGTASNPYEVSSKDEITTALNAVTSGSTAYVTLTATITCDITINADTTIILNLGVYSIKNGSSGHTITNNGTLTINGEGTVDCKVEDSASAIYNNGTLTLNGGTYTRSKDDSDGGVNYYVIVNHGTATINDGVTVTTDGTGASLIENGWYTASGNEAGTDCVMIINGGTFEGGLNTIKNDAYGVMTINGGTFSNDFHTKAADGRVIMNYNVMTINDGTFSMTIDNTEEGTESGNTALILTSAIFESGSTDTKLRYFKGELTINGGSFTYTSSVLAGYLVYAYGAEKDNYVYSQAAITITDGTFTANGTSATKIIYAKGIATGEYAHDADATINISGGDFINNSTANAGYTVTVASGCTLTIEDGYFESNGRYVINYDNNSTVSISGGTFVGKSSATNARVLGGSSSVTLAVTGGIYSSDVTEKIDAESYIVTETTIDDNTYYVVSKK